MCRGFGQPSEGLGKIIFPDQLGFGCSSAGQQLGNRRATRHCRNTALRLEADIGDPSFPDIRREAQHITASWIFDQDGGVWMRQLS